VNAVARSNVKPPADFTLSTVILRHAVELAAELGVEVDAILTRHQISPVVLAAGDARLPAAAGLATWVELARATGDPNFGIHVAQRVPIDSLDVVGCAMWASLDLREAIEKFLHFQRLMSDAWHTRVEFRRDATRLTREAIIAEADERHLVERALAIAAIELRRISEWRVDPIAVRFRHDAPADIWLHREVFRCPTTFGSLKNELTYATRDLQSPVATANPNLALVLDRYAEESLARLPPVSSWIERVRHAVATALRGGPPSLAAIAARLRISTRTMQRRLAEEHTSLRNIVDDVRRELAAEYLANEAMAIDEVAFLLGFADTSSFFRAFRRWSGQTPARFRAAERARSSCRWGRCGRAGPRSRPGTCGRRRACIVRRRRRASWRCRTRRRGR
jgi:AraC-like DNA-binding protein